MKCVHAGCWCIGGQDSCWEGLDLQKPTDRIWLTETSGSLTKASAKRMHLRRIKPMYRWPSERQLCRTEPRGPGRHQGDHMPPRCTGILCVAQGRVVQTDQRKWTLSSIQHQGDHNCSDVFSQNLDCPLQTDMDILEAIQHRTPCLSWGWRIWQTREKWKSWTESGVSNPGDNSSLDWTQPCTTRPK